MMADFRKIDDSLLVSPQLSVEDIMAARDCGVGLIINNRPDGEEPGQPSGAAIEEATKAAGMEYVAIPIGHDGFSPDAVAKLSTVLENHEGRALAFCRSGTRSTFLWALSQAHAGTSFRPVQEKAAEAGYDIAPLRPAFSS